jgi:hypothetical protein
MQTGVVVVLLAPAAPEHTAELAEWYRSVHIPELNAVTGIRTARVLEYFAPLHPKRPSSHPLMVLFEIEGERLQTVVDELVAAAATTNGTDLADLRATVAWVYSDPVAADSTP